MLKFIKPQMSLVAMLHHIFNSLRELVTFLNVRNAGAKFNGGLQFLPALVELRKNQEKYSVPHYLYLLWNVRKCDYFC